MREGVHEVVPSNGVKGLLNAELEEVHWRLSAVESSGLISDV